jgi:hypothetical protein
MKKIGGRTMNSKNKMPGDYNANTILSYPVYHRKGKNMKIWAASLIGLFLSIPCFASEKKHTYQMSLRDEFVVAPKDSWKVKEEKYLPLRFANVEITPKKGADFSLMLYFKCDTPDLAAFDSPEKMEKAVKDSSKKYLPHAVEKTVNVQRMKLKESYGCYVILTDAELAKKKRLEEGEFKYITRGMIRLSKDTALGFSLMSNEVSSPLYQEVRDYIRSFIKAPQEATTFSK